MMEGYKTTVIGEIPSDWECAALKDAAWYQEGPGLRKWQFTEQGIKVINITNIVNGYLELQKTSRHISWDEFNKQYRHFECDAGDIVIASSGNSYCKHGIVREQDLPLVMNTSVIRFKPSTGTDYNFLNQFLKSDQFKKQIDFLITGGAQPNFGPEHLAKVYLPYPSEREQKKIASILSAVDNKLDLIDRKITATRTLKKGLMQRLFSQGVGTRDADGHWQPHTEFKDSELGRIPAGWDVKTFAELIKKGVMDSIQDGNHGEKHPVTTDFVAEGIPFIMANCISQFNRLNVDKASKISQEQYLSLRIGFSKPRDVLLTHKGTIGLTALVGDEHGEIMLTPQVTYYRTKNEKALLPEYIYTFFQSLNFQSKLKILSQQSTRSYIGIKEQAKQICLIPPIDEQHKIANIVFSVDQKIDQLSNEKKSIQQLKKGLMQKLLTGQWRVNV